MRKKETENMCFVCVSVVVVIVVARVCGRACACVCVRVCVSLSFYVFSHITVVRQQFGFLGLDALWVVSLR